MHRDHRVPEILGRVDEALVAQDAGVVHAHVDLPEGVEGGCQDRLTPVDAGHRRVAGDGFAARGANLAHDGVGEALGPVARAVPGAAQVVHPHRRTFSSQRERVFAPDSAAGPRDDRNLPVEQTHLSHLRAATHHAPARHSTRCSRSNQGWAKSTVRRREKPRNPSFS